MSDYQAPAFIAALTDAQLVETVRAHTERLDREYDEQGSEFDYVDYMDLVNEKFWAQEELDQRAALRRYSAPVALVNRPFAVLAGAL